MSQRNVRLSYVIFALIGLWASLRAAETPVAPDATEGATLALWLFDELQSPGVTLTDAGPVGIDLRLDTGGVPTPEVFEGRQGMVPGKFGRALRLPVSGGQGVVWPRDLVYGGSATIPARGHAVPETMNLGYFDWTLECWFRGDDRQESRGTLWELRSEVPPPAIDSPGVNSIVIDAGRTSFALISKHGGRANWVREISIPTDSEKLNDGQWHHIAFSYLRDDRQLRHFVDGQSQPLPQQGGFLPTMALLSEMLLGRDSNGGSLLTASLDELRISAVARYRDNFEPPGTLARHGDDEPTKPTGPPLLFNDNDKRVIELGDRKHVFIDGALLARHERCQFVPQPPVIREATNFRCDRAWEATPRFGGGMPDLCSVFDDDGELKMLYTNGGMWGGKPHVVCLATSHDGLAWKKPHLNKVDWLGSTQNNIVLPIAAQGMAFQDQRAGVPADERYKFVAWWMNRGLYVFDSPNLIDWRRNETVALPFDPDGSISIYWDDQVGRFRGLIRALDGPPQSDWFRGTARFEAPQLHQPWPFQPARQPHFHGGATFRNIKPTQGELPLIPDIGQTYRHMALKYAHAPDVYMSFPWRYLAKGNVRPGSFVMTSRDGERWTTYEDPYYFPSGWKLGERTVIEALSEHGLVRRGDELWQFGTVRFTEHGGALYAGVEHDGTGYDRLIRLTQRLDGFVALVGTGHGFAETKPLTFAGNQLELNLSATTGTVRVELAGADGKPLEGFHFDDCEPLSSDGVRVPVLWKSGRDLASLVGQPIVIRIQLHDAKLFALQFVRSRTPVSK